MNKLLLSLALLMAFQISHGQEKTGTSPVSNNNQRLLDLKSKLDKIQQSLNAEQSADSAISNKDILVMLFQLDSKVNLLLKRQDSLILALNQQANLVKALSAKDEAKLSNTTNAELCYLVVESQRTNERAEMAKKNWSASLNRGIAIRKAKSGYWYYVTLEDGFEKAAIQKELLALRKITPTAWFITGAQAD